MYTATELKEEIESLVAGKMAAGQDRFTKNGKRFERGADVECFVWWSTVRKLVGEVVDQTEKNSRAGQLSFLGKTWDRIQEYYPVDGQQWPRDKLRAAQWRAQAARLRSEARSKSDHADECDAIADILEQIEAAEGVSVATAVQS